MDGVWEPHMPTRPSPHEGQIRSEFSNDPNMREIVEMYVTEMPERISMLSGLWSAQKFEDLRRVAHQLKGASGGYGFAVVGAAAGRLEGTLLSLTDGGAASNLRELREQVDELLSLCRRVSL